MAATMALLLPPRATSLLLSLLFLTIAAAVATAVSAADTVAPPESAPSSSRPSTPTSGSTTQSSTTFLRARCATTLYPAVCYDSLLPYAAKFHTSRVRLARAAADVAAARIHDLSARLKDLRRRHKRDPSVCGGPRGTAALEDCTSSVASAAGLAKRSSGELARLADEEEGGPSSYAAARRRAVSNAQTWLSAGMSDEETCVDGFSDAGEAATGSPAGKLAAAGVASVRQYTSNALALVNGIPL